MKIKRLLCDLFGHVPAGKVHAVGTNVMFKPIWQTEEQSMIGGQTQIGYYMRKCSRCGYRVPIDAENAERKAKVVGEIARVMNASRRQYGLLPVSWDD